jgi:hypothetical protein
MKSTLILISSLFVAGSAFADARVSGSFKIVKPDGQTVIAEAPITPTAGGSPSMVGIVKVKASDAFVYGAGKCAFNVRYEESSDAGAKDTTNRIYSNDTLIAQNTHIDVAAGQSKSIWTQPYLVAGQNNVKVVVDATSDHPSTGWVRVMVDGICAPQTSVPAPAPSADPKKTTPPPPPAPAPVTYGPGTGQWNTLFADWGYSNYAVTQLKGKGYGRYNDLAALNADLTKAVQAGRVEQSAYNALMTRWASFSNDPVFQALMKQVQPSGDHK